MHTEQQSPDSGVPTLQDGRIVKGEEQEGALYYQRVLVDVGR